MSHFVSQAASGCGGQVGRLLAGFEVSRNRPTRQKLGCGQLQAVVDLGSSL